MSAFGQKRSFADPNSITLSAHSSIDCGILTPRAFAVFPLIIFTGDKTKMGDLVAPMWMRALAWPVAVLIAVLNAWLLWQTFVR